MLTSKLTSRLHELRQLDGFVEKYRIDLPQGTLSDLKDGVFRDFYKSDSLAYNVARGRDSYVVRMEPIGEKYNTFWKKVLAPDMDEGFDENVWSVLNSMNNVGVGISLDSERFTTEGRRKLASEMDNVSLRCAGLFAFVGAAITAVTSGSPEMVLTVGSGSGMLSGVSSSGIFRVRYKGEIESGLGHLEDVARRTDRYLVDNYVGGD